MYDFKHISTEELQSLLQQGDIRLIDVRTDAEVARGKIPRGESIPLHLIPLRMNELDKQAMAFALRMQEKHPGPKRFLLAPRTQDHSRRF